MTGSSDFKRRVRARMARTQERYTTARAALLGELARAAPPRAKHDQTFALSRLLATAEQAPSEALLLGLGGGVSAQYHAFEYKDAPPLVYIGTRCNPQYAYDARFAQRALASMGVDTTEKTTTSARRAEHDLLEALEGGPVMAWVGKEALLGLPALGGATPWTIVVHDVDGDMAGVEDAHAGALEVPLPQLAAARSAVKKQKHRLLSVRGKPRAPTEASIREALRHCVSDLDGQVVLGGSAQNFGLAALEKWAVLMVDEKSPKGWPKLFGHGAALLGGLRQLHTWIFAATDGAGFRPMYAEFIRQAYAQLGDSSLAVAADLVAANGRQWKALVDDAFDTDRSVLKSARRRFEEPSASHDLERLTQLTTQADEEIDPACAADIRARLHSRLVAIIKGERRARDAMAVAASA